VNAYSGQPKLNLKHRRKVLSWLEGLLEIVGLEVYGRQCQGWYTFLEGVRFLL